METNKRCRSPYCITGADGVKGRVFTPPENATGLSAIWCEHCVKIGSQLQFFAAETAGMIRRKYHEMRPDDLPVKERTLLTAFVRDLLLEFGEEL